MPRKDKRSGKATAIPRTQVQQPRPQENAQPEASSTSSLPVDRQFYENSTPDLPSAPDEQHPTSSLTQQPNLSNNPIWESGQPIRPLTSSGTYEPSHPIWPFPTYGYEASPLHQQSEQSKAPGPPSSTPKLHSTASLLPSMILPWNRTSPSRQQLGQRSAAVQSYSIRNQPLLPRPQHQARPLLRRHPLDEPQHRTLMIYKNIVYTFSECQLIIALASYIETLHQIPTPQSTIITTSASTDATIGLIIARAWGRQTLIDCEGMYGYLVQTYPDVLLRSMAREPERWYWWARYYYEGWMGHMAMVSRR